MTQPQLGESLPDFEANVTGDKIIKRSDFLGKYMVLYFYPKDRTPGCTLEGQAFRDNFATFTAMDTSIFGVSRDSIKSHENFKCKQAFPFDLISDADEKLCTLFNVIKMKNMYGKQVLGIERSTFLIDPQGTLIREWRKVSVKGHCEEVIKAIKSVQGAD